MGSVTWSIKALITVHFGALVAGETERRPTLFQADHYDWPGVPRTDDMVVLGRLPGLDGIGMPVTTVTWDSGFVHLWFNVDSDLIQDADYITRVLTAGNFSTNKAQAISLGWPQN